MHQNTHTQSVQEFCKTNGISQSFFYKLRKQGKAPRCMIIGRRRIISSEAAQEWREAMESDA